LVPAAIAAGDDGTGGSSIPIPWIAGGAALLALILLGGYVIASRRRPAYGASTPGALLAWRRFRERRRVVKRSRVGRSGGLGDWWRVSGPVTAYRESKASRHAAKTVRRQIEERKRLNRKRD
jgi:hypothetical protein